MTDKKPTMPEVHVVDSDVQEIFVTGPCNVSRFGDHILIVCTAARPKAEHLFAHKREPPDVVVVARLIFGINGARGLAAAIERRLGPSPETPTSGERH
jgi:hypothetical protein